MNTIEKLTEQLESNTFALRSLDGRLATIKKLDNLFGVAFSSSHSETRAWALKVKKRVYRMRYRILENLQGEIIKEMNATSNATRNLILEKNGTI